MNQLVALIPAAIVLIVAVVMGIGAALLTLSCLDNPAHYGLWCWRRYYCDSSAGVVRFPASRMMRIRLTRATIKRWEDAGATDFDQAEYLVLWLILAISPFLSHAIVFYRPTAGV